MTIFQPHSQLRNYDSQSGPLRHHHTSNPLKFKILRSNRPDERQISSDQTEPPMKKSAESLETHEGVTLICPMQKCDGRSAPMTNGHVPPGSGHGLARAGGPRGTRQKSSRGERKTDRQTEKRRIGAEHCMELSRRIVRTTRRGGTSVAHSGGDKRNAPPTRQFPPRRRSRKSAEGKKNKHDERCRGSAKSTP